MLERCRRSLECVGGAERAASLAFELAARPKDTARPVEAGYEPFVQNVAFHTLHFGKPVLMFNGDSHNPLSRSDPLEKMHPSLITGEGYLRPRMIRYSLGS